MTSETEIKNEIKEYLDKTGWVHFPISQHGYRVVKGLPDRVAFKQGVVLFIEIKTQSKKSVLSAEQKMWAERFTEQKCNWVCARSVEDLDCFIKNL